MDINRLALIIDDYADEKKHREFGELLCYNFDENQIITYIKNNMHTSDFLKIWKHLVLGLSYFQRSSLTIIKATLKHADEEETTPILRVNELLNYIINVLTKYETEHLVELVKFCLLGFQNMNTNRLSWKDIFPEIISVLKERESIEFDGKCLSGKEFEKEIINILCNLQWEPSRLTVIISIFCDLSMSKEDYLKVLTKMGSYIESLTPQEIPSFVYQLLILSKNHSFLSMVVMLQQYFGLRLYKHNVTLGENIAEEDESGPLSVLEEAELSVFFHIRKITATNSTAIKDYLNFIKPLSKAPEILLHPFHLKVLLVIYENADHKDKVWDILKNLVLRYYNEISRRETSIWFNRMCPKLTDLEELFDALIFGKTSNDITESLVDFGLKLMNTKSALPHIVDSNVLKLWDLGRKIIIKIFTKATKHAKYILDQILQSMRASQNKNAHIECLIECKRVVMMVLMMEGKFIHEMMEDLQRMPGSSAILFLDIVIPLTNLRTNIKDQTILLFRKSLYSSKTETRQMAVIGFTRLLTSFDIKNPDSLSQMSNSLSSSSSSSGPSIFTQLSLHRSQMSQGYFSDEALIWEILSILKRCFMQKLEIRSQLYKGLIYTAFKNKLLSAPILEILWTQISKYFIVEEETLPPLEFTKLTITKNTEVIQEESLGKLLYVMGIILVQIQDEDYPTTIGKVQKLMDSICDRMITCELVHFELDDGTDLSDVLPECKEKVIILKEAMRVYEALLAYKIKSWNSGSLDNGPKVVSLFNSYSRLLHFAKNIGKCKKGKKKKDDTTVPLKAPSFKVPNTIMDINVVLKVLELLHEPTVEWTTMVEANSVRSNKELHRYFFQATRQIFTDAFNNNKKKTTHSNIPSIKPNEAFEIACIIYKRCIKTLDTYKDFDCVSAIEALECFQMVLHCVTPFKKDGEEFDPLQDENSPLYLWKIIKTYQKLFQDQEDLCEDPEMKKLPSIVLNNFIFLSTQMPSQITGSLKEFYDWMMQYAKDQILINKFSASLFFTLFFNMHLKYKQDSNLFKIMIASIGNVLGTTREVEDEEESFKVINELSLNNAFICLISSMVSLLDDAEIILNKLKCEQSFRTHVPNIRNTKSRTLTATSALCSRQNISEKEASISELLYVVANLLSDLTVIAIPPGVLSDNLLKIITQIFNILVNFTKYFSSLSSTAGAAIRAARYEELVKLIGRTLSPNINFFILHLEEEDKKIQMAQSKKKSVSIFSRKQEVLKNTRLIPKLVYGMEQFSKCVMQLSSKTKIDLHKYIGTGTTRDFRILVDELPEHDDNDSQENDDSHENVENEESETAEENITEDMEQDDIIENSDKESSVDLSNEDLGVDESNMPPRKKLKY